MKHFAVAVLLSGVSVGAFAGNAQSIQFTGLVRNDNDVPVRFDIQVPAKQQATLLLGDGSKLEFFTPGSLGHADAAQVRLVSAAGAALHTATYPGSVASTSLDYLVCEGKVTYISPSPSSVPSCGQQ
jgi:hypothetical protein